MDQLKQLQHLSLVNKVTTGQWLWDTRLVCYHLCLHLHRLGKALKCASAVVCEELPLYAELENHLGISEKTLAEFIIELASGKASQREFQKALVANHAEMPDSLVQTIWNVIQRLTQVHADSSCIMQCVRGAQYQLSTVSCCSL